MPGRVCVRAGADVRGCVVRRALLGFWLGHSFGAEGYVPVRMLLVLVLDGPEAFAANAPGSALRETAARWRALQARGLRAGAWGVWCVRCARHVWGLVCVHVRWRGALLVCECFVGGRWLRVACLWKAGLIGFVFNA